MTRQKSLAINVLAAAAALACFGTASAQSNETYNPSDYILLNGSVLKPDSNYPTDKVGYGGGIKFGIPLSPSWDLQVGGNYGQSKDNGAKLHQYLAAPRMRHRFLDQRQCVDRKRICLQRAHRPRRR